MTALYELAQQIEEEVKKHLGGISFVICDTIREVHPNEARFMCASTQYIPYEFCLLIGKCFRVRVRRADRGRPETLYVLFPATSPVVMEVS